MAKRARKRGMCDFTIWFADGSRAEWSSLKPGTNADIAGAIRRYLVPFMERYEEPPSVAAVDPSATDPGTPPTLVADVDDGEWNR